MKNWKLPTALLLIAGIALASPYNATTVPDTNDNDHSLTMKIASSVSKLADGTATPALPSGAATSAKQDTGNTSLSSIDTKLSSQATAANQASELTALNTIAARLLGATNSATSQVSASNVAGTLVIARSTRKQCTIYNSSTTVDVYIREATVTTGNGFILKAGAAMTITTQNLVQCITSSSTATVHCFDEYY